MSPRTRRTDALSDRAIVADIPGGDRRGTFVPGVIVTVRDSGILLIFGNVVDVATDFEFRVRTGHLERHD
jgi:hypothetical protein